MSKLREELRECHDEKALMEQELYRVRKLLESTRFCTNAKCRTLDEKPVAFRNQKFPTKLINNMNDMVTVTFVYLHHIVF
jgi:hypothetical protein